MTNRFFSKFTRFSALITVLFLWLIVSTGCEAEINIDINQDNSGSLGSKIVLHDYMSDQIASLTRLAGDDATDYFDEEKSRIALNETPGISNASVIGENGYNIFFDFTNIGDLAQGEQNPVISFSENDGRRELAIEINKSNYTSLLAIYPSLNNNALVLAYGPSESDDINRSDYLDMIQYSFGEEAVNDLPQSYLVCRFNLPDPVIEQRGGELLDTKTVQFDIPLLDILVLDRNLEYNIVY